MALCPRRSRSAQWQLTRRGSGPRLRYTLFVAESRRGAGPAMIGRALCGGKRLLGEAARDQTSGRCNGSGHRGGDHDLGAQPLRMGSTAGQRGPPHQSHLGARCRAFCRRVQVLWTKRELQLPERRLRRSALAGRSNGSSSGNVPLSGSKRHRTAHRTIGILRLALRLDGRRRFVSKCSRN